MCSAMIYEYKFIIIHTYSPTSTPPQKHTMPEDRFLTYVLIYLTLGQAVRQAIERNPLLKARVINSSAMLCAADFVEVPTPRTRTLSLKFYTKELPPPPYTHTHFEVSFLCLQITAVAPKVSVPTPCLQHTYHPTGTVRAAIRSHTSH
jgi:hypothetical protein